MFDDVTLAGWEGHDVVRSLVTRAPSEDANRTTTDAANDVTLDLDEHTGRDLFDSASDSWRDLELLEMLDEIEGRPLEQAA